MDVRFWGTRGSIPSPGALSLRYGGNTSCVELCLADGSLVILDAGSGIRPLGAYFGHIDATLLLSHYHWDHIQGLPFFAPAYHPDSAIRILGPEFMGRGPDEILGGQMAAPYFPAPSGEWCGVSCYDVVREGEQFAIGSATVRSGRLCHPGVTFGYRIEEAGRVLVYISDNEEALAEPELRAGIVDLARDADILLHDCQYTEEEYATRCGWGHSTPRQAAAIARDAGAKHLFLFHHDPAHCDEHLEMLAAQMRELSTGFEVRIAREGEMLSLGQSAPDPVRQRSASA